MLALVFMQPFDLHIEERRGIDLDPAIVLDDVGEKFLVGVLDGHELALELGIVGPLFERAELVEIACPSVADPGGDEVAELRVAGEQPTARRDPVRFVVEFPGIELVELREEIALEELRVEGGNPVHRMAADHGKVRHANHLGSTFLDE